MSFQNFECFDAIIIETFCIKEGEEVGYKSHTTTGSYRSTKIVLSLSSNKSVFRIILCQTILDLVWIC